MSWFSSIATVTPRNDAEGVPYAPQRDLAYIYRNLLTEVFRNLDSGNWSADVRAVLSEMKMSDEEIDTQFGDAVKKFATGLRNFLREAEVKTPEQAFDESGFNAVDPRIKMAIYGGIGVSMTAGFFYCAKDNTLTGQPTPAHVDWIAMLAAADRSVNRLLKAEPKLPADDLDDIKKSPEFIRQQVLEFDKILRQHMVTTGGLTEKLSKATDEILSSKNILEACDKFLPYIQKLAEDKSLQQKVKQGLCLFIKAIKFK